MKESWRPSADVDTIVARSAFLQGVREFFADRGVIEVQTSVLGQYGVADLEIECLQVEDIGFLQPSPEYQMKRLLAAGLPSCYQICPAFRASESGNWHNPEFTMLEWYRLGFDDKRLMLEVQELVDSLLGPGSYSYLTVRDLLNGAFGLDIGNASDSEIEACANQTGLIGAAGTSASLDFLMANAIETTDLDRLFVFDYPKSCAALARTKDSDGVTVAARFELVIDGLEIANGYHELLDADEYLSRMKAANQRRHELGNLEMEIDKRFVAAMRVGLPDCAGVAVGLDRLFALTLGKESVHDVIAFPSGDA